MTRAEDPEWEAYMHRQNVSLSYRSFLLLWRHRSLKMRLWSMGREVRP